MTQDNRLWVLMSRRLSGEASPAEAGELKLLLKLLPDEQHLYSILHSYFAVSPVSEQEEESVDPGLGKKNHQMLEVPATMPLADMIIDDSKKACRDLEKISPVWEMVVF